MRHQISGRVIKGDGYGKTLGFPTANLERRQWARLKRKPKFGVWAGWARFKLKAKSYKLKAGIVIGPLDTSGLPKIESHLIGFKGNLYGKKLALHLIRFLRPFRKYKNIKDLQKQIQKDLNIIRKTIKL